MATGDGQRRMMRSKAFRRRILEGLLLTCADRGKPAQRASESGPVPACINSAVLELVQLFCEETSNAQQAVAAAP